MKISSNPTINQIELNPDLLNRITMYQTTLSVLKSANLSPSMLKVLSKKLAEHYGFDGTSILTKQT